MHTPSVLSLSCLFVYIFYVVLFHFQKILSGSLQSLLASREPELLLKAKSDVSLACTTSQSISMDLSSGGLVPIL
jgi:hypothetical protein